MVGKMSEFKAALIDLDGFLITSEEIFLEANRIYFKQFGIDNFTEEMHRAGIGKKSELEMRGYIDRGLIKADVTPKQLVQERDQVYMELAPEKLKLAPGALEFLEKVKINRKTALVTSSLNGYVDFIFDLFDISKFFDVVVTGDMVADGKPNPAPYLVAAEKLGVKPLECVVFEDAPAGVLSGKAAGMRVIAVPNRFVKGDKVFEEADEVFRSLVDVERWLEEQA